MHILDTDTLTHLHAGHPRVIQRLRELDDPDVVITIITKIEMLRGRFDYMLKAATSAELVQAQQRLLRTEELLSQISVLHVNEECAAQFDRLRTIKGLGGIGRADLLVASIALAHRAVLVTRNVRHFRHVPDLMVINWVD